MSERTKAMFRGQDHEFPTQKEAYTFLIDHFLRASPDVLDSAFNRKLASKKSLRRDHFARSPKELFPQAVHLAADDNMFAAVSGGWFANLNLAKREKRNNLHMLAHLARLEYGKDWSWDDEPPPPSLEDL